MFGQINTGMRSGNTVAFHRSPALREDRRPARSGAAEVRRAGCRSRMTMHAQRLDRWRRRKHHQGHAVMRLGVFLVLSDGSQQRPAILEPFAHKRATQRHADVRGTAPDACGTERRSSDAPRRARYDPGADGDRIKERKGSRVTKMKGGAKGPRQMAPSLFEAQYKVLMAGNARGGVFDYFEILRPHFLYVCSCVPRCLIVCGKSVGATIGEIIKSFPIEHTDVFWGKMLPN